MKRGGALVATDDESVAALAHIKEGRQVYAEIVLARNPEQHRKFMLLASIVAESLDLTTDSVRKDALKRLGHTNTYVGVDGRIVIEAKSMRFVGGMPQQEFDEFFDKAVNLMAGWIRSEHTELMRRFNEVAADKRYEEYRRQ